MDKNKESGLFSRPEKIKRYDEFQMCSSETSRILRLYGTLIHKTRIRSPIATNLSYLNATALKTQRDP